MKFCNPLDSILNQTAKVRILRRMILKGAELSGRQIAEEAEVSPPTAHKALQEFVRAHVVIERKAGRAILFKLNRENYLVREMLTPLFEKEKSLFTLALEKILKHIHIPIISIILFGSMVQRKETSGSDIDLLLIVDTKNKTITEEVFDKINSIFLKMYGRIISPYILTTHEFQNKYKKRSPVIVEIVKTGIMIRGKSISDVLNYGR